MAADHGDARFSGLLVDALRRPVSGLTCIAAVAASLAWWVGADVGAQYMDHRAFSTQPWRLLTSTFLHVNVLHLAFNVYWTWKLGRQVEERVGSLATMGIFLLLAVGSAAGDFALDSGGVGLSGVGYGLFGLTWVASRRTSSWRDTIDPRTTRAFVIWFFLCIAFTVTGILPVANVAHAVGALLGAALGLTIESQRRVEWLGWTAVIVLMVLGGLGASVGRPYVNRGSGMKDELLQRAYDGLEARDYARAAEMSEKALSIDERDWRAWHYLGSARIGLGRADEAEAAYLRAYELEPKDPSTKAGLVWCRFHLATSAYDRGDLDRAIGLYRECTSLEPDNAPAWHNLGIAYQAQADWKRAIEAYEKAVSLDPSNTPAREAIDELERHRR